MCNCTSEVWSFGPSRNDGGLLRHQRVHVFDRLDEIFLEFLHHGTGGFDAVDQADALSDEIADEVARLRIACRRGAVDGVESVAADDALQRHRQRAGAVGAAVPRVGPDRAQLPRRFAGAALERMASREEAAIIFSRKISEVSDSTVASHTEPVQAPAAPIAMQAAICRPVMMPPAASTGTSRIGLIALITSGTSTMVETSPQ